MTFLQKSDIFGTHIAKIAFRWRRDSLSRTSPAVNLLVIERDRHGWGLDDECLIAARIAYSLIKLIAQQSPRRISST